MIVPMKKVSIVLLEREKREALKKLRRLGVMHLEQVSGNSGELAAARDVHDKLFSAYMLIADLKTPAAKKAVQLSEGGRSEVIKKADELCALDERRKICREQVNARVAELERYGRWGETDPADFAFLAEKGTFLYMYEIPADKYRTIPEDIDTLVVNRDKSTVRFLLIGKKDTEAGLRPAGLPAEAFAVPLPSVSTKTLKASIEALVAEIRKIDGQIEAAAPYKNLFQEFQRQADKDVEFENVCAGIEGDGEGAARLVWLSGFIPVPEMKTLEVAAKAEGWAFMADDPSDEDLVPTKLKNNKLVSLIYPLSDFLGTVPGYREYDISGWFLLFFCIFFGMIFGDGGYGLLLVLVALGGILGTVMKKQKPAPVMNLLLLLGLCTVGWGAVTCTWFGLAPAQLPDWIKRISVPAISNVTSAQSPEMEAWVKQNLQVFCFSLALLQLSIAHFKGIARYIRSPRCLGELGSMLMLWGIFNVVLGLVVDGSRFPVYTVSIVLIAAGFLLSFVFANYDGNLGQSILESCKNIILVLLGVVNVFSDIVSYIRLWAVGLAGGAISATVNSMAGPTLGGALLFVGILLLVFGHGLNMVLNVLSVIVHGVRLNTLEFSSHLGMSWSGFAYEPFSETVKK